MPCIPVSNRMYAAPSRVAPPDFPRQPMRRADLSLAQRTALAILGGYKVLVSPLFAGSCRYVPSGADYAAEAVQRFGVIRGSLMAARRLARCHPLGGHGFDAVPADDHKSR